MREAAGSIQWQDDDLAGYTCECGADDWVLHAYDPYEVCEQCGRVLSLEVVVNVFEIGMYDVVTKWGKNHLIDADDKSDALALCGREAPDGYWPYRVLWKGREDNLCRNCLKRVQAMAEGRENHEQE